MSDYTLVGQMPRHFYVWVDSRFTHKEPQGFIPAVWFGLVSFPGRVWGCTVMLESGAVYRNLPLHALAWNEKASDFYPEQAQLWDCYSERFTTIVYDYLKGLRCKVDIRGEQYYGHYLFTAAPIGDGFSHAPEQAKEFCFIELDNGRFTCQPTNKVIFDEKSFTRNKDMEFPTDLRRQTEIWSCE